MDFTEGLEQINRLKDEQKHYLSTYEDRLGRWTKFKNDYESLSDRLSTLPDKLEHKIMIPVSKKAFLPGKLVHTNEILVLLGDNWLIERSAKQACEIIERRVKGIDKNIEKLNKERDALKEAIQWTEKITQEKDDFINIEEKIDDKKSEEAKSKKNIKLTDEEKKELRKKQQARALKIQNEINAELVKDIEEDSDEPMLTNKVDDSNKNNQSLENINFMEKLSDDIKNLNFEEELTLNREKETDVKNDLTEVENGSSQNKHGLTPAKFYFEDMLKEYEKSVNRENNLTMTEAITSKSTSDGKKGVKWSDVESFKENIDQNSNEVNEEYSESDENSDDEDSEYSDSNTNHKFTSVIKIKHTKNEEIDEIQRRLNVSRNKPDIDNPGDIYKHFYQPKSILKTKTNSQPEADNYAKKISTEGKMVFENSGNENSKKFDSKMAFSGEIVEKTFSGNKQGQSEMQETTVKKRVSKFKASRSND